MSGECQVNVKSQSELDIGGRETCKVIKSQDLHHLHSPGHEARPDSRVPLRRRGSHREEVGQVIEAGQAALELALLVMLPRTEVQGVALLVVLQQGLEIVKSQLQ